MNSYSKEYVEINTWVKVLNLSSGEFMFCRVVPCLTQQMCKDNFHESAGSWEIFPLKNEGDVWVHTPLGGAILGRMVGDEFGFYENGSLQKYRILKILS